MFEIVNAADGYRNPAPAVPWLVQDVVQKGALNMIHGQEKMGKSMLLANLALAGAFELPEFLGFALQPGGFSTLILQGEMHLYGFQQRLNRMLAPLATLVPDVAEFDRRLARISYNNIPNIAVLDTAAWSYLCRQVGALRPDVLMIDPYAHVMQGDENSNQEVGEVLQKKFGYIRETFECAIVFTHHNSKVSDSGYGRPASQQARGANRFTADSDFIWSVVPMRRPRPGAPPTITLKYTSRYSGGLAEPRVRLNPDTFWFEKFDKLDEKAEDAARVLNSYGKPEGVTGQEFDELLVEHNVTKEKMREGRGRLKTAKRYIAQAVARGLVRADDGGQGRAALRYFAVAPVRDEDDDAADDAGDDAGERSYT